jgi:predicted anti-sigma-YlaC factor YlaD
MRCRQAKRSVCLALDGRLSQAARPRLQAHLEGCPSCREWQQAQAWLRSRLQHLEAPAPAPGFQAAVQARVAAAGARRRRALPPLTLLRPALLRAAAILVLALSALLGYALSSRLERPSPATVAAAFDRALNLDAFADLPGGSFAAVHERLLTEEFR